ncbi:MAG: GGDEF domain-containing protein [Gammaproteobacteria bacterium]|nr:MAG: GGDEF domain-containing protein [Gammaproteobacteria bacterium]
MNIPSDSADSFSENEDLSKRLDLLKKCVVRLSLAADGIDTGLDKQLEEIREHIRKDHGNANIEASLGRISDTLIKLEDKNIETKEDVASNPLVENFSHLIAPLTKARLSNELQKKIQKLNSEIRKQTNIIDANDMVQSYASILSEAIGLANEELSEGDFQLESDKPGFLQRLFTKGGEEQQDEQISGDELVSSNVKNTLLNLLEHLILPDSFKPRAKEIKKQLLGNLNLSQLPDLLDKIVALVVDSATEETHEFEDFLQHITEQLIDIKQYLASVGITGTQAQDDTVSLGESVKAQVADITETIKSCNNLEDLKKIAQEHVSSIVDEVDNFCSIQAERQAESNAKIETLKTRLEETQEESALLRERLVIQRAHAQLDPLTKLPNRQAYDHQLNSEFNRWQRYNKPLTMIISDIDFFKKINDTFGHAAGDKVLKTVARVLQTNLRDTDFIARFGGEEFVILMPETHIDSAVKVAEKLRTTIMDCPFHSSNRKVPVTMSFGVCEFKAGDTKDSVFEKADKALYQAKESGRNKVCAG